MFAVAPGDVRGRRGVSAACQAGLAYAALVEQRGTLAVLQGKRGGEGRVRGRDGTKKKREGMNTTFPFSTALLRRPSNRRQTAIKTLVSARRRATKRYRSEGNLPLLLLSAGSIEISLRSRLAKTPAAAPARQEARQEA